MMKTMSGRPGMSLIPAMLASRALRSRSKREISFLLRPS